MICQSLADILNCDIEMPKKAADRNKKKKSWLLTSIVVVMVIMLGQSDGSESLASLYWSNSDVIVRCDRPNHNIEQLHCGFALEDYPVGEIYYDKVDRLARYAARAVHAFPWSIMTYKLTIWGEADGASLENKPPRRGEWKRASRERGSGCNPEAILVIGSRFGGRVKGAPGRCLGAEW
ncbi:MAG: hypothetical protein GC191_12580, partial [Azospirillum sp.]|nr:hypothetical protein [Azospirillum sp.]